MMRGAAILLLCAAAAAAADTATSAISGPLAASSNPHYFQDARGRALVLSGSQTWNTLQDWGSDGSPRPLDFDAFVRFLSGHGHNFTLLWYTELPRFCWFPATDGAPPELTVGPHPWLRTGPGTASDGAPKFDLGRFNPAYFTRLRTRVRLLNDAGIYAGVYLFTGEWLNIFRCANDGFPFTGANNINGVDDGYDGKSKQGTGAVTMTAANAITRIQDAYVEQVIDTLNDLPNVLWIVSEEAPANSAWWNAHQIAHVRAYESKKRYQHPIGFAAPIKAPDSVIYNSDADWVAPAARISPVRSCGTGKPPCKVNVNDSDHSYFGMWNESAQQNRNYEWENFLNGNQVLFMDPYVVYYPREKRNVCASPMNGVCAGPDARYDNFRDNLGYILRYSRTLNLALASPQPALSSTGYCLAHTAAKGAEYLVYAPSGGTFVVDVSAMPGSRRLKVEWFNPASGAVVSSNAIRAGSHARRFTAPFSGDAVLYLVDSAAAQRGRRSSQ